ncbi:hypothetical protein ATANTOWER_004735 [Ataeniobius toweri]|uniref:Uncharacterized protein n=1 Tax=Ataeniobius toweri TaxID=208326 RepID=A0ABU7A5C0_9TELE|nr:hypothetical protein [Ataeniobius toweri]
MESGAQEREAISQGMCVGSSQSLPVPCNATTQPSQDQLTASRLYQGRQEADTLMCDINWGGLVALFSQEDRDCGNYSVTNRLLCIFNVSQKTKKFLHNLEENN